MLEYLPGDINLDILSRLPVTSLLQCKLVCRAWKHLAQDPLLVSMHFSRTGENEPCLILHSAYPVQNQLHSLELSADNEDSQRVNKIRVPTLPEFDVVGSCKGLLCLRDSLTQSFVYIYNPFTRDYIELPKSVEFQTRDVMFGFGFHHTTKEYKVIKVAYRMLLPKISGPVVNCASGISRRESVIQILDTLGSAAWRSISRCSFRLYQGSSQVLVNGRLHWSNSPRVYFRGCSLFSLDLADERLRHVPKPDCDDLPNCNFDLVVLRGCFSVALQPTYGQLEIWVMKDYDVKESWIKEFSITAHVPRGLEQDEAQSYGGSKFYCKRSLVRVLCLLKNGDILLEYKGRALVSYDPKTGTFKDLLFHGMPNWFEAVVHEGNLTLIGT